MASVHIYTYKLDHSQGLKHIYYYPKEFPHAL